MANPYWPHLSGLELHNHAEDGGESILADNLSGSFGEIDITSTSGTNLVTNGAFTSNTTGWITGQSATIASVAGGQAGNCLQITEGGADNPYCHRIFSGLLVVGKRYKFSYYVKEGTGTAYQAGVYNSDVIGGTWVVALAPANATGSWVQQSAYFVALESSFDVYLYHLATSGDGTTVLFDTVEVVREGTGGLTTEKANISGLVSYANDAAAGVGGLVAGDLYTITGSDPLALAVKS